MKKINIKFKAFSLLLKINIFIFLISFFIFSTFNFIKVCKTFSPNSFSSKIVFFDIGQGDASLFFSKKLSVLIDGGPDNLVLEKLGRSLPYFKREIDFVILSHYHDDHISGLIELVKRYKIKKLFFPYENENKEIVKLLLENSNQKNSFHNSNGVENIVSLKNVKEFNFLGDKIIILNPAYLGVEQQDNNSLLTKIIFNNTKILLSGDNELAAEKKLVNSNFDLSANIFKASHHGSKTSNSLDFLKRINMETIVISAGKDNRFNHPSLEVVKRLNHLGIEVYGTDENGDVELDLD